MTAIVSVAFTGLDQVEAAKKKQSTPSLQKPIYEAPMRVVIVRNSDPKCEPTCPQWIAAEGEITDATPQAFRNVFKQMGKQRLPIIIRSPGGSINAALSIGRMIRERNLTVAVGYTQFLGCSPADKNCKLPRQDKSVYQGVIMEDRAFCNSACPMLLAGGTTRLISYRASAGVHEPKTTWTREYVRYREYYKIIKGKKKITSRKIISRKNVKDKTTFGLDKRLRKTLSAYYKSMGINLAILDETTKAKYQDMNFLTQEQTDTLGLRTSPLRASYLSSPSLCGTTPTSAVCVLDKARDPAVVTNQYLTLAGISSKAPEMSFRLAILNESHCQTSCVAWISAEGVISSKTPEIFRAFMKSNLVRNIPVVFNSEGGDAQAAIDLGQEIRNVQLDTVIGKSLTQSAAKPLFGGSLVASEGVLEDGGICQGACVLAYAGGQNRNTARTSTVRMHNPLIYGDVAGTPKIAVAMNLHLQKMGVSPRFMTALHGIKRTTPKSFTQNELLEYAVSTGIVDDAKIYNAKRCKPNEKSRGCLSAMPMPPPTIAEIEVKILGDMKPVLVTSDDKSCRPRCPLIIYGDGKITAATVAGFKAIFQEVGHLSPSVVLNSPGGTFEAASEIGMLLRERGLEVAVSEIALKGCSTASICATTFGRYAVYPSRFKAIGRCEGNCVVAFSGGKTRILKIGSALTLMNPQFYSNEASIDTKLMNYFNRMGVDVQLINKMRNLKFGEQQSVLSVMLSHVKLTNSSKQPEGLLKIELCQGAKTALNCIALQ
jgi:hypothetical protein